MDWSYFLELDRATLALIFAGIAAIAAALSLTLSLILAYRGRKARLDRERHMEEIAHEMAKSETRNSGGFSRRCRRAATVTR